MDYILVSLNHGGKTEDLRIPSLTLVEELISIFNFIYGHSGKSLHAEPRGIMLDKSKTLAAQGVMQGALLTLN